jgi:hypothetical protein
MNSLDKEIKLYLRERHAGLIALDMTWARKMMGGEVLSDLGLLAGMHKARYDIETIPAPLRHESGEWLRDHGMADINGAPLLPPDQLPH